MINLLKWVGNIFIVGGLYGIGNKSRKAFLASCGGETCWIIASIYNHDWALASICVVFLYMAFRAYVKWGNNIPATN